MDWCGITCSSLPTLICIKTIKSWAAGASCFVPALLDTLSPEQRACVWDNPRTVPVSGGPGWVSSVIPRLLMVLHCSFCSWRKLWEVREEGAGCQEQGRDGLKEPQGHSGALFFTRGALGGWLLWLWSLEEPFLLDWRCPSVSHGTVPVMVLSLLHFWICDVHAGRRGWWGTRTTLQHPGHCTRFTGVICDCFKGSLLQDWHNILIPHQYLVKFCLPQCTNCL